jgi:hypothetical protein
MTTINHLSDGAPSACEIDWDLICWDKVENKYYGFRCVLQRLFGKDVMAKRKHCSGSFLTRPQQNSLRLDE